MHTNAIYQLLGIMSGLLVDAGSEQTFLGPFQAPFLNVCLSSVVFPTEQFP